MISIVALMQEKYDMFLSAKLKEVFDARNTKAVPIFTMLSCTSWTTAIFPERKIDVLYIALRIRRRTDLRKYSPSSFKGSGYSLIRFVVRR